MIFRPLDGIRILDLTHVLAGPYATGQLALMGGDVIRIEHPDGADFVRRMGGTEEMRAKGLGAAFLSQNAGKRSVALDLKAPEGREIFLDLAATRRHCHRELPPRRGRPVGHRL